MHDDVHRTGIFPKAIRNVGNNGTPGWSSRRHINGYPAKTLHNTPGLHRFETWQNRVSGFFEKEEVPAAKFDIDKDAQIAHARIAVATSNVVGKGPGNSDTTRLP